MNGWTAALLTVALAVNPPAVVLAWQPQLPERRDKAKLALVAGLLVLAAMVLLSGPILDLLDVNVATYRLAAAAVLLLTGARWVITTRTEVANAIGDGVAGTLPFALSLLAPAPVLVAMAAGADGGVVAGLAAVAVAVGITFVIGAAATSEKPPPWLLQILTRLVGAAAVATAVAMALDAARTV